MTEARRDTLDGRIVEALTGGLYSVALAKGQVVLAHVEATLRPSLVRLLPGDGVTVQLTARDPGRARIVARRTRQGSRP